MCACVLLVARYVWFQWNVCDHRVWLELRREFLPLKQQETKKADVLKKTAPAETNGNSPDHLYRRLSALSYRIFPVTLRQKHRLSTRAVWSQTSDTNCVNWSWEICLFSVVRHISGRKVEMLNYSFQLVKIEDLPFILFNIMLSPFLYVHYVHSEPCRGFICFLSIFLHFQHFLINFFFLALLRLLESPGKKQTTVL